MRGWWSLVWKQHRIDSLKQDLQSWAKLLRQQWWRRTSRLPPLPHPMLLLWATIFLPWMMIYTRRHLCPYDVCSIFVSLCAFPGAALWSRRFFSRRIENALSHHQLRIRSKVPEKAMSPEIPNIDVGEGGATSKLSHWILTRIVDLWIQTIDHISLFWTHYTVSSIVSSNSFTLSFSLSQFTSLIVWYGLWGLHDDGNNCR